VLGHTDNYILANSLSTPSHIVPEWYFLPFYAILRAIPDKLGGVLTMLASILVLFFIPFFLFPSVKLTTFRPFSMVTFCFLCACLFFLGWLGSRPAEVPYIFMGQLATFFYFFYWFILLPVAFWLELCLWDNAWFLVLFRMAGAGMFFGDLYLFYKRLPLDVDRIILNNGRHNIPYLHSERE
jgi:quinol-cytochrome oxidoreductase complex cytochrome b subunit